MTTIFSFARTVTVAFAFIALLVMPQTTNASLLDSLNLGSALDTLTSADTGSIQTSQSSVSTSGSSSGTLVQHACAISVNDTNVDFGDSVIVSWDASGYSNITINGQSVSADSGSMTVTNITADTIFQLAAVDGSDTCATQVIVVCVPPPVLHCELEVWKSVNKSTATPGEELTYTIKVKNTGTGNCSGDGVKIVDELDAYLEYLSYTFSGDVSAGYGSKPVYDSTNHTLYFNGKTLNPGEEVTITWTAKVHAPNQCGDFTVENQAKASAKELNNFLTWEKSQIVETKIENDCPPPNVPSCDSFTASPSTIVVGNSSTLSWSTTNATRVTINNGIGDVAADGSTTVSPTTNTTYVLTVFGTNGQQDSCLVPVHVSTDEVPVCKSFTVTPNALPAGGGNVTLAWDVEKATAVSISPNIGAVGLTGSRSISVNSPTTFVLTAVDADNDEVTCSAPVTVADQEPFTCADNVNFTASDYSIDEDDEVTLRWDVTDADSVRISHINATSFSGSEEVSPNSDITYTLTATKGSKSVDCPIQIEVDEDNGGGGGSPSPRCELEISDERIERGEEITLRWDSSRAREITIVDDRGNVIVSTDDDDEGSVELRPTRDTEYTMTAERGSRDRECRIEVEVEDDEILTEIRDQQPLVAGIALSKVPYTGFEAGPVLTLVFYLLLMAWALYVAYFLIVRRQKTAPVSSHFATAGDIDTMPAGTTLEGFDTMKKAEAVRPEMFAATAAVAATAAPTNLPTEPKVTGYENYFGGVGVSETHINTVVNNLENRAHSQKALLSSDAIEYFLSSTEGAVDRDETLDQVIATAKTQYPLEDGWVVINQARMQSLCEDCEAPIVSQFDTLPTGAGSLAEAIATGNVVAAYDMIGSRPMFALADAAADFDAVVRNRKGGAVQVSNLLKTETDRLTDEQIKNIVTALTGALDGTYTDEASAVKMAIMKAVKEIA